MGLIVAEILSHGAGQKGGFVPLCPAGQDVGRDSHNFMYSLMYRRNRHRDKTHSVPKSHPFSLLGEKGAGQGSEQAQDGGRLER